MKRCVLALVLVLGLTACASSYHIEPRIRQKLIDEVSTIGTLALSNPKLTEDQIVSTAAAIDSLTLKLEEILK